MWKQKIGISIGNQYSLPLPEVIKIIKAVGFDAVSPVYKSDEDLSDVVNAAKENGLLIQSLHAPFGKAAAMWRNDTEKSVPAVQQLTEALYCCARRNIPILVVHTWIGFEYTFDKSALYFENFDKIVTLAEQLGVRIAFENTEGEEYFFALMERYRNNKTVGFCWDSGHEMCYNHSKDLLAEFGDRLIMTHLNDNLGISRADGKTYWTDDLHLLPFDGVADWQYNVERLQKSRPLDVLNFELNISSKPNRHENDVYGQMSLTQYFTEAYKRACKIAYQYSNTKA